MGRVINVGFNDLTEQHIETLSRAGLLKNNEIHQEKTVLPFIEKNASPEKVKESVVKTLDEVKPQADDILIISGMPDVCVYVLEHTSEQSPTVLVPIGSQRSGTFKLFGFREIIRSASESPSMHLTVSRKNREEKGAENEQR